MLLHRMRQTLAKIPDGRYEAIEYLDDQSCLKVKIVLTRINAALILQAHQRSIPET